MISTSARPFRTSSDASTSSTAAGAASARASRTSFAVINGRLFRDFRLRKPFQDFVASVFRGRNDGVGTGRQFAQDVCAAIFLGCGDLDAAQAFKRCGGLIDRIYVLGRSVTQSGQGGFAVIRRIVGLDRSRGTKRIQRCGCVGIVRRGATGDRL